MAAAAVGAATVVVRQTLVGGTNSGSTARGGAGGGVVANGGGRIGGGTGEVIGGGIGNATAGGGWHFARHSHAQARTPPRRLHFPGPLHHRVDDHLDALPGLASCGNQLSAVQQESILQRQGQNNGIYFGFPSTNPFLLAWPQLQQINVFDACLCLGPVIGTGRSKQVRMFLISLAYPPADG